MLVNHAPFIAAFEAWSDRGIETEKGRMAPFGRVISNLPAVLDAIEGANVKAPISGHLQSGASKAKRLKASKIIRLH